MTLFNQQSPFPKSIENLLIREAAARLPLLLAVIFALLKPQCAVCQAQAPEVHRQNFMAYII
jgi:hypothetical protein